jgi:hypothetical protein
VPLFETSSKACEGSVGTSCLTKVTQRFKVQTHLHNNRRLLYKLRSNPQSFFLAHRSHEVSHTMSESPKSGPQSRVDVKSRRTLSKKASIVNKPRASTSTNVKRGAATASANVSTVGHVASDNVVNKGDVLDLFASVEDKASKFEGFGPRDAGFINPSKNITKASKLLGGGVHNAVIVLCILKSF